MNRGLARAALLAGVIVLFGSLQFGVCLPPAWASLILSPMLAVGAMMLWLHVDLPHRAMWLPPVIVSSASLGAVAIVEFGVRRDFSKWFCPLLAGAAALLTLVVLLRSRARCSLCSRRLQTQAVTFQCPRCTQQVCDETCWNFEHRRCRLCLEQRVPALPVGESWWLRGAGPRSNHGRCQLCLGSAVQLDLRACPHCRRTQCRDCWDFNNGECARCGGALPDLPTSLTMTAAQIQGSSEMLAR